MTLVEVIVSLAILALAASTFLPLAAFVSQSIHRNEIKMAANSLAESVMEEIKALPYEVRYTSGSNSGQIDPSQAQIGTVGGNPPGLIPQTKTQTIGGTVYTIDTRVSWGKEGNNYTAYKKIEVIVCAPDFPGKVSTERAKVQSIIAQEGEKSIVPGGSLLVRAVRNSILQTDARVSIIPVAGGVTTTGYTDDTGGVYFAEMAAGNYYIDMDLTGINMMPQPRSIQGTYPNQNWNSRQTGTVENYVNDAAPIDFEVDYPVLLCLQLQDADGQEVDKSTLWAEIQPPANELSGVTKTLEKKVTEIETLPLWPKWTYDLQLKTSKGGTAFYTRSTFLTQYASDLTMARWDGTFTSPAAATTMVKSLTIKAGKPTINLNVVDKNAGIYKLVLTAKPDNATIYYSYTNDGTDPAEPSSLYNPTNQPVITGITTGVTLKIKARVKNAVQLLDGEVVNLVFAAS
jgi:type II secretory pathway pseudopilin PulG